MQQLALWRICVRAREAIVEAATMATSRAQNHLQTLSKIQLDSLELRRLRFDLIYAYKIIFGILETDVNALFTISSTNNFTRGHNFKLLMPQSRIDVLKYFFACRIVRCWNSLNAEPEHFSSLTAFKKFLQQTDLSKFMLFSH